MIAAGSAGFVAESCTGGELVYSNPGGGTTVYTGAQSASMMGGGGSPIIELHVHNYLDGQEISLPTGLPLGIVDGIQYQEFSLTLPHGAQLALVSDGVVEARSQKGELLGFDRTAAISKDSAERIAQAAQDFGQDDDITVVTLTRLPSSP